jgi:hypothetical protein
VLPSLSHFLVFSKHFAPPRAQQAKTTVSFSASF